MKKHRRTVKKILAAALAAALSLLAITGNTYPVQADISASASRYNDDPTRLLYSTKVEDQALSNYCWAYVANSVLETYLQKTGKAVQMDFSESDMIQCLSGNYGFNNLAQGGSFRQAAAYWTRGVQYGPIRQADGVEMNYYVGQTADLGKYRIDDDKGKQAYIQEIKNLVAQYGSVGLSVYFDAATRAQTTKNGAYYYPQESTHGVNHGVTVVGWNDQYPAQQFYNSLTASNQPRTNGAFLVKNSWGADDASSIRGNTGYYWISYENYFQDAFTVTQVLERSKLCSRIYETDYRGLSEYTSGTSYSQIYALGEKPQKLSGIGTYVKAGATYHFFVNGQELKDIGGEMAQSGWHTFPLTTPLEIESSNATVELRVEVEGADDAVPVAANAANETDEGNVCLKAYTIFTEQPSQPSGTTGNNGTAGNTGTTGSTGTTGNTVTGTTVTGVSITPRTCTVRSGQSQSFLASVQGTGNPSQTIEWQLAGSTSAKTTLQNGVLYIGSDEQAKTIYVYASAAADLSKVITAEVTVENTVVNVPQQQPALYTVTFLDGGEVCGSQNVRYGEAAYAPALTKDGYQLSWDCTFTNVTGNLIVNAVWTKTGDETDSTDHNEPGSNEPGNNQEPGNGEPGSNDEQDNSNGTDSSQVAAISTINQNLYTCWQNGTAQYTKCKAKNRITVDIPAAIRQNGIKYIVTELKDQCISKNKKVRTINIGKNATKIGSKAFYGCKNLSKIKIKSENLESIGSAAFSNIAEKAAVYVPRSRLAQYRAMVRKSGNKKIRVKAYN